MRCTLRPGTGAANIENTSQQIDQACCSESRQSSIETMVGRRTSPASRKRECLPRCSLSIHNNSTILKLVRIGEHKASPLPWTGFASQACLVAKECFFPFTQKFHCMCHSPTKSLMDRFYIIH